YSGRASPRPRDVSGGSSSTLFFFFKQKTAYEIGLGIPYTTLFRSSKIITSILSFISGRLPTKSNQIKQLIRNGRSASLQRTFKKSFTSFSHSTRNKTRDGLIRVRNIRALNGRFNTSITQDRKSGSAGMPRPISYAVFCLKKKKKKKKQKN